MLGRDIVRYEVDRCIIRPDHWRLQFLTALPRCSDPDDQRFLEPVRDARADWLITKE